MSTITDVLAFSREYINHPSARTKSRKAKISQALFELTGQKLGTNCGICYIEAIFKIINRTKMANYELRQGYVAQFIGVGFRGVRAFTNLNLKTDPAKYDPIAEEYLRLYPERVIFFTKSPKIITQAPSAKFEILPEIKPEVQFSTPDPKGVFNETMAGIKSATDPAVRPSKSRSKKSVKKSG